MVYKTSYPFKMEVTRFLFPPETLCTALSFKKIKYCKVDISLKGISSFSVKMVQILSLEPWTYSLFSFLAILLSSLNFAFSGYLSLVLHLVFIAQAFNSQPFPYYSLNMSKVNILSMMCSDSSSILFFLILNSIFHTLCCHRW